MKPLFIKVHSLWYFWIMDGLSLLLKHVMKLILCKIFLTWYLIIGWKMYSLVLQFFFFRKTYKWNVLWKCMNTKKRVSRNNLSKFMYMIKALSQHKTPFKEHIYTPTTLPTIKSFAPTSVHHPMNATFL